MKNFSFLHKLAIEEWIWKAQIPPGNFEDEICPNSLVVDKSKFEALSCSASNGLHGLLVFTFQRMTIFYPPR